MQPRKIPPKDPDETWVQRVAEKTEISADRLREALQGKVLLTTEERDKIAAAAERVPRKIKKPFGN